MILDNFVMSFFTELIKNKKNTPLECSVLMYAYFQMLYNFGALFYNYKISNDRQKIIPNYRKLKKQYLETKDEIIIYNFLLVGHNSILNYLFQTPPKNPGDFGFSNYIFPESLVILLKDWSISHIQSKSIELNRAGKTPNISGLTADYTGSNDSSKYWTPLIVPTGTKTGLFGLPLVDKSDPTSFKIQPLLGKDYYMNRGFALNPEKKIKDFSESISKTWETGLKEEIDKLLNVYENLDDGKKIIAEFFAGTDTSVLPPPGFFIIIAMLLSQKYNQNLENNLKMYFMLSSGIFDASIGAWYYKSKYNQARPISLIRNNYAEDIILSWTPIYKNINSYFIKGKRWLPYQELNFVTPPFQDVASGHSTFSRVAGELLNWWFNNPVLYDGKTTIFFENQKILCPLLPSTQKCLLGEFIFEKGISKIEPGITPQNQVKLHFKNLKVMYKTAGLSRIYGGIHTFQTNAISQKLGKYIFLRTKRKLIKKFKFTPPF